MGVVYRAHDLNLPRDVALKLLPPEMSRNEHAVSRFKQEVNAASSLDHPNIARLYDGGVTDDGRPYLVMEYVNGESLQQKINAEGPLELKEILRIGMQIAAGLAAAHEQGLIHRDVKPANIILNARGGMYDVVKLLDFSFSLRSIDRDAGWRSS